MSNERAIARARFSRGRCTGFGAIIEDGCAGLGTYRSFKKREGLIVGSLAVGMSGANPDRMNRKSIGVLFLTAVLFSSCGGSSTGDHAISLGGLTVNGVPYKTQVEQVLVLVNQARADNGLSPLSWNQKLSSAAQSYAQVLSDWGTLSHTGPDGSSPGDRITAAGYSPRTWGENIAYGYATPDAVVTGWMNSSGHRANILGSAYKEIGIGVAGTSTRYWVQDFGAQ